MFIFPHGYGIQTFILSFTSSNIPPWKCSFSRDVKYCTTALFNAYWSSNLFPDKHVLDGLWRYRNLLEWDQEYVVDAVEVPTSTFAVRLLSGLKYEVALSNTVALLQWLIYLVSHLMAFHNFLRVLQYLSLSSVVFGERNSHSEVLGLPLFLCCLTILNLLHHTDTFVLKMFWP